MANQLIKSKTYSAATVGQPYRAPQPARTGYVSKQVCGYKNATWRPKVFIRDVLGGDDQEYADFLALWRAQNGARAEVEGGYYDASGKPVAYSCWTESVPVTIPAQPGQAYIPAKPAGVDYNLGWNAGGRSRSFVAGDGQATFQAGASNVGAICGLNGYESPLNYTGVTIRYGWYLARGTAKVIEFGAVRTGTFAYDNATVFKIKRVGRVVTYWVDETLAFTSTDTSTEPLWLQAALYSGDDEIFAPVLGAVGAEAVTGTLTLTLPPVSLLATDSSVTRLRLELPAPRLALGLPEGHGILRLRIPPATFAARNGQGGVLRLQLPQPAPRMGHEGLEAPSYAVLNLMLPPAVTTMHGLTGAVGQLTLNLPAPRAVLSDRPIGRLNLPLPGLFFTGRNWPLDELPIETSPLLLIARAGLSGVVKLPTQPMTAVLSGSMSAYAEVTLGAATMTLLVGGSINVQAEATLATVPMTLLAGGNIGVLSELNEVFVMNITGGKPGGTTQYKNYEFNSVAKIGGRYYGASPDGLFLLDGDDDAGEPIEASFGLGQLDFGSPQLKTVAYCYLGTAAGGLVLNVQALYRGAPVAYDYPARGHGASMREVRFDLGKGLSSSYVMPTFYNNGGDAFEVDSIRFLIAESTRRI